MYIIKKEPNPDGSRPPMQSWDGVTAPEGYALCPDNFHDIFYSTSPSGFVHVVTEEQVVNQIAGTVTEEVRDENGEIKEVEKTVITDITTDVVVSMAVNQTAIDAYIAAHPEPEPVEPEPSVQDALIAQTVDIEYRLALLESGLTEEAE